MKLQDALFRSPEERRLPKDAALSDALGKCKDVFAFCEMNAYGPLYFLPTQEWIAATAKTLRALGVKRVLEVAAGDGFLSASLQKRCPKIRFIATDSGAWVKPSARMNAREKKALRDVAVPGLKLGAAVERIAAKPALAKHRPDLVLVSWAPPGPLVEQLIRANIPYVLDIATHDESCGKGPLTWRFHHTVLDAPALCRLDTRPKKERHSRVSLYYARAHPDFFEE
jgi:hypothetical protein